MFEIREGHLSIPPPRGDACGECGELHGAEEPHNKNSLVYQHRFWKKNGRYPNWEDAMEHCGAKMKEKWVRKLEGKGIKVGGR
jgi:hypothetical protein